MCNCTGVIVIGGQTTYTDCNGCSTCRLMPIQQPTPQNTQQTTNQPRCTKCDDNGWTIDPVTKFGIQCSCQIIK